jgi:hypothetical protein
MSRSSSGLKDSSGGAPKAPPPEEGEEEEEEVVIVPKKYEFEGVTYPTYQAMVDAKRQRNERYLESTGLLSFDQYMKKNNNASAAPSAAARPKKKKKSGDDSDDDDSLWEISSSEEGEEVETVHAPPPKSARGSSSSSPSSRKQQVTLPFSNKPKEAFDGKKAALPRSAPVPVKSSSPAVDVPRRLLLIGKIVASYVLAVTVLWLLALPRETNAMVDFAYELVYESIPQFVGTLFLAYMIGRLAFMDSFGWFEE